MYTDSALEMSAETLVVLIQYFASPVIVMMDVSSIVVSEFGLWTYLW